MRAPLVACFALWTLVAACAAESAGDAPAPSHAATGEASGVAAPVGSETAPEANTSASPTRAGSEAAPPTDDVASDDEAAEPSDACALQGVWRGFPPVVDPETGELGALENPTDLDAQTLRLEADGRMFLEHADYKVRGEWRRVDERHLELRDTAAIASERCGAEAWGRYVVGVTDDCEILSLMVDEDPCTARHARLHTAAFRGWGTR